MEGGGEGMVAVIRGLRDAGLAVTLTSGELPSSKRASIYAPNTNAPLSARLKPSNDEGTNTRPFSNNISAQACDGIYTSSYQEAHCFKRPSSPPVLLSEFPIRKDPSKNDGNFRVGWERYGSGELPSSSYQTTGTSTYKPSLRYPYRGSQEFDNRNTEAFAASLRRYTLSPGRTPSAELVQKMISYTYNKTATTAKTTRSSLKERIDAERRRNRDKNIQTYTRMRHKNRESVVDNAKSSSVKRMRLHSPVKDSRDKRFRDNTLNETYDYLRTTSPHYYTRPTEVRYLSDVSKCIKDTIKQIVEDNEQPTMCSQMQSRYLAHRKKCLQRGSSLKPNGMQPRASVSESKSTGTIDRGSHEVCLPTCPYIAPPCCYCKIGLTIPRQDSKEEFGRQVSEKVANWLLDIPAYANMSEQDKQRRIDMVEQLANAITDLKGDEDVEEKARIEIEKCLESLPMWLPASESDKDDFKKLITDNLVNKLSKTFKGVDKLDEEISKWVDDIRFRSKDSLGEMVDKDKITTMIADRIRPLVIETQDDVDYHETLKNEIVNILDDLPVETLGNEQQFINNLADKLTNSIKKIPVSEIKPSSDKGDEFDNKISQWMKDIKFKKRDSLGQEVDKQKIVKFLTEKLKSIALDRPEDDAEYQEVLKNKIIDTFEDLPLEVVGNKDAFLEKMAIKLTNIIKKIPSSKIRPKTDQFDEMISQWIAGVKFKKKDSQGNVIDKHQIAHILSDRLKPLAIDRPADDDDYQEALKNEIIDILEDLPLEVVGSKDAFLEKIAIKLTNTIKKIPTSKIRSKADRFDEMISQWIAGVQFKRKDSQGNVIDKDQIAHKFADRLKSLAIDRPEDDEDYQEVMKNEIIDILDELPIKIIGNKEQFVDKFASKLTSLIKKIPPDEIKPKGDKFDVKISQWIEGIKFKKRDSQGNIVDKRKITESIAERLKSLATDRPEDNEEYHDALKQIIVDILDELPIEVTGNKEKFVDKLASKLTNKIEKIPTSEIKPKGDKIDEKVSQWIEGLKFKKRDSEGNIVDKQKITESIAERLKSLATDRPEDNEEYHDALKQIIVDILEDLPIEVTGNKEKFVDKLASKLTNKIEKIPTSEIKPKGDKIDEKISQWIGGLKFKKKDSQGNIIDKQKIADTIAEKLRSIAIERPDNGKEYHDALKKEIVNILDELPIEVTGNKEKFVDKLAGELTNKIKKIPASEIKTKPTRSDVKNKFRDKIIDWLKDIPELSSVANVKDKGDKGVIEKLDKKLQTLQSKGFDEETLKEEMNQEIQDWIKTLLTKQGGQIDSKTKSLLAEKLIGNLIESPASSKQQEMKSFTEEISNWLENISELSGGSKSDNNKMVERLAKKIQDLNLMDEYEVQNEIMNWLEREVEKKGTVIDYRTKEKLAKTLASNLFKCVKKFKRSSADFFECTQKGRTDKDYKEDCFNEIRSWLQNIPELSGNKEEKNLMAEMLAKKLHELQSEGIEDDVEIQDEITNWLLNESEKKGLNLDDTIKDDMIKQLVKKIAKVKPPERHGDEFKDKVHKEIWSGLKKLPGIKESEKNKELMKELAEKVISISEKHGEEVPDDIIQNEMKRWVDDFVDRSGLDVNSKYKRELIEDLTSKMRGIIKPKTKLNKIKQTISKEVSDIIDNSSSMSPKEKENVRKRIATLLARNIDGIVFRKNGNIKKNIVKILGQETNVSPEEAEKLAESFISRAKQISDVSRKSKINAESPDEIRQVIQDKVKYTLNDYNISNPKEIEKYITDVLEDQIFNGIDTRHTKKKVMEILQSTNLSNEDAKNLTTKLALQAIDLSSILHPVDTTLPSEFTPSEKETFNTSAIKDITEFINETVGEMDAKSRNKLKIAAQNLAGRLGDAISDPNKTMQDKDETLNAEVSNFLKMFSVPDQYGPLLVEQLRNLAFTSTPRQSEQSISFYPKRSSSTISESFISSLENIIQNWIINLPVELKDKTQVSSNARDLADDIADRQRYLQSHPDIKQSEAEKLEFLKYQVFRTIGKSVEAKNLATIMNQTPTLLSQINEIALRTPPIRDGDLLNVYLNEISKWLEDVSAEIKNEYLDNNKRKEIVKELADKILNKGKGQNIDDEIIQWLTPIVKRMNQTNIRNMSENLKQRLKMKGLVKEITDTITQSISTDQIKQDSIQFLEENLSSGISDWLKSLPLYQRRTSKDKRIQESIAQELCKEIKNLIISPQDETDIDVQILEVVKRHIEKFPMDEALKTDKAYIEKVSAQLVDYLNNMQMFDNISSRQSIHPLEYLISTVNDWMTSIPLDSTGFVPREIDEMKMNLLNRLNGALKDSTQENDQVIRDEIKRFLETLPLDRNKLHDTKFIPKKVEELFNRILGTPILSQPGRPTISRDVVESAVQDWSAKLPFSSGQSRKSVSDKIQNFVSDISSVLKDANATAVDNYKDNLRDKTVDFLKQLPIKFDKPSDLNQLAEDLLSTMKNKAADLSPKPVTKNAADTLYDNVATWCDDLPISHGNTPEEKERINTIKQNLASKLVNKIGELNMNPEIFNDDFLYEHLLQEEIGNLLSGLPYSPDVENNLQSIKENLMGKIREAKEKTKDELAGQNYKQKLRETISKSLPFDVSLSSDGPEAFEILVDKLADAYVDLHFISDNEEQKAKYKNKIADEITKYCNDYLSRHPEAPLDATKINQDLYNALKSIPTPKDEVMRSEAEHIRVKEEINDWMKNLPMTEDSSPQQAQVNKIASVLAKKLLKIEKEKEINPDLDHEEKARKEIMKLLKKLPLKPGGESKIDRMVENLIDNLKSTEKSRRISASTTRHSIDLGQSDLTGSSVQESAAESSEDINCLCRRKYKQKIIACKHYKPTLPKSSLSPEDRAHLERIRMRTPCPSCRIHRVCSCKDASVNPLPIDNASQTDVCPNFSNICPRVNLSSIPSPCSAQSQQEVAPQVIIKEYLWDSCNSKLIGPVFRLPCAEMEASNSSVQPLHRPLQKSVSIQPSPCVITPCPKRAPCPASLTASKPCINLRSPCPSPHHLPTPKPPCIYMPRAVISSRPSNNLANRSLNTVPCEPAAPCLPRPPCILTPPCVPRPPCAPEEITYCSPPRRPVGAPKDSLCLSTPCSPDDTESDVGPNRCFPRVVNLGSFDGPKSPCANPCQRRKRCQDEQLADYNNCQDFRRRIYRMPNKPNEEGRRCCKCSNPMARAVPRHRESAENVRQCSRCCGIMCPHPMGLFFR